MTPREERVRTIAIMSAILGAKEACNWAHAKTYTTFVARAVLLYNEASGVLDENGQIITPKVEDARL